MEKLPKIRKILRERLKKAQNNKNEKYFWYTNIEFYKLKDFKTFIKLIDDGIIKISINIGVYKDEKRFGKIFNHGMTFDIRRSDIRKLYSRILI